MKTIPFNKPAYTKLENQFIEEALELGKLCGDGPFSLKCKEWLEFNLKLKSVLLTPNCTQALEMAAILLDIQEGDEVIMPSFTFVSTANAFVLRGANIIFVDVEENTMNIDVNKIERAITKKTKAIVPVHYAGSCCDMDKLMDIANRHNIHVVEDAAQALLSKYKNRYLGSIGHMGTFSFHETKNITSGGEGGALVINDDIFKARAEIVREKGTDRSKFIRGEVDKYSWVDIGSSYLPSELQAAYLYGQLISSNEIIKNRLEIWHAYYNHLEDLEKNGSIIRPLINPDVQHNGHIFHIILSSEEERNNLMQYLKDAGIYSTFHYVPLHTSKYGIKNTVFSGLDEYTTFCSERLLRLPIYYGLEEKQVVYIVEIIKRFFNDL